MHATHGPQTRPDEGAEVYRKDDGSSTPKPRDEDDSHRHKRKRQTTSCEECRRRKIKCDRVLPCGPCTRRGEANLCHGEFGPEPTSNAVALQALLANRDSNKAFTPASANAVERLAERITQLERTVLPRLSYLEDLVSSSQRSSARPSSPPNAIASSSANVSQPEVLDSESHDAAVALKDFALGNVGLSRHCMLPPSHGVYTQLIS
jgi:hypothetical protein